MTADSKFSRKLKIHNVFIALATVMMSVAGAAATRDEQALYDHQYYLLQNYKLKYTEEIFDYCVGEYGPFAPALGSCMSKNDKLRRRVLSDAREQLGKQSLALNIYDECLDYYPMEGVKPVGECAYTRLYLQRELNDDPEERRVYRKCNLKWREQGSDAVDTCARSEVIYYQRWGKFNDE